ncbi:hypothetical protein Plhal710r2_c055g0164961 [Plasmopara halstedii]
MPLSQLGSMAAVAWSHSVGFKYNETTTRALTLLQTRTLSEEHGTLTLFQIDFLLMLDPLKDVDEEISCLVWVLYRVSQASMH